MTETIKFVPADLTLAKSIGNPSRRHHLQNIEDICIHLMDAVEKMDQGLRMAIDVVHQQDKRIRALELAQRKADRKKPVIVNQHGERAN
jgi:hypothetical protein